MSRPERRRPEQRVCVTAVLTALALAAGGCGKGSYVKSGGADPAGTHVKFPHRIVRPKKSRKVAIPLPLNATRAAAFANAVDLRLADVTGARILPRSGEDESEQQSERCSSAATNAAVGGGRSPKLDRGQGLDHETISSAVVVLANAARARADLAYTTSRAGLACYAKILSKSLEGNASSGVQLGRVHLQRLVLPGPGVEQSTGIRITARVSSNSSSLSVPLYIDAVGFLYGPAEIDLYASSFVQPEPLRTEQELLKLLEARALLNPL